MTDSSFSSRVQELYRILSEAEKRDLNRYLDSPYFNRDKNLVTLHRFITSQQPIEVNYNKKAAWKFIFGKTTYNEKKLAYMVSDLLATIEQFIYLQYALAQKPHYIHALDEYFTLRGATESKATLAKKITATKAAQNPVIGPSHFLEQHFKSELLEELHTGSLKEYTRYVAANRKDQPGYLDTYYVIEKLRQLCLVANDNNVFGTATKCFFENEIITLAAEKLASNAFVQAYVAVYRLLTQKSESQYFKLKKIIATHGYDFEDTNLAELFAYARNFCIARVNAGHSGFFTELFELYEQGLQKRVLLLNGEINERNYKNIVTTALRIKKYDWTLTFLNEYKLQLNKTVRENAYSYNLANYYFNTGEFAKALRYLQKVQLSDLFYGLDARALMAKCYYELDEREAFLNHYHSFRIFILRRKNVSEQHRKNYSNFLRLAKKLINLRPRDKKAIAAIATEIKNAKALADKGWLEEKLGLYL
jgi:hypothetical protein